MSSKQPEPERSRRLAGRAPAGSDRARRIAYQMTHEFALAGQEYQRLRLAQLKCDRCPTEAVGVLERCQHADGTTHLVAEVQRRTAPGKWLPVTVRLDVEPADATVVVDCEMPTHGSATLTVAELRRLAVDGLWRIQQNKHGAPKSVVHRLTMHSV